MDRQIDTLVKQSLSKDCVAKMPRGDTASPDRATARLAQGADANQPATCSMLMPPRPPRRAGCPYMATGRPARLSLIISNRYHYNSIS